MRFTKKGTDNNYVVDTYISLNEPWKSPINKLGQLEDLMEKYDIKTLSQVEGSFIGFVTDYTEEGRNHIGQLLKLEEDLGIDLITLFKSLEQKRIYIKKAYCCTAGEEYELNECFYINEIFKDNTPLNEIPEYAKDLCCAWGLTFYWQTSEIEEELCVVRTKDYGKTWALTKEELKDE